MRLYERVKSNSPSFSVPFDPIEIAKYISTGPGAIEFAAAEIQQMQDEYRTKAQVDISKMYDLIWFLHNAGSITNRANKRAVQIKEGTFNPQAHSLFGSYASDKNNALAKQWEKEFEKPHGCIRKLSDVLKPLLEWHPPAQQ